MNQYDDPNYNSAVMFVGGVIVGIGTIFLCWFMLNQEKFIKKENGRGQEINQLYDFGSASGEPSPVWI